MHACFESDVHVQKKRSKQGNQAERDNDKTKQTSIRFVRITEGLSILVTLHKVRQQTRQELQSLLHTYLPPSHARDPLPQLFATLASAEGTQGAVSSCLIARLFVCQAHPHRAEHAALAYLLR